MLILKNIKIYFNYLINIKNKNIIFKKNQKLINIQTPNKLFYISTILYKLIYIFILFIFFYLNLVIFFTIFKFYYYFIQNNNINILNNKDNNFKNIVLLNKNYLKKFNFIKNYLL